MSRLIARHGTGVVLVLGGVLFNLPVAFGAWAPGWPIILGGCAIVLGLWLMVESVIDTAQIALRGSRRAPAVSHAEWVAEQRVAREQQRGTQ